MQTSDKENRLPKYHNLETIPARVFFHILQTNDLQQLKPKPGTKNLDLVFSSIYDDFFLKSENPEAKEYLELSNQINFMEYKISTIQNVMLCLFNNHRFYSIKNDEVKKMLNDILDALEKSCDVFVDINNLILEEIERIMTIEVGIIKNDLNFAKIQYEEMIKGGSKKAFEFYEAIVSLSNAHGRNIDESLSLAYYIALEKSAIKNNQPKPKA